MTIKKKKRNEQKYFDEEKFTKYIINNTRVSNSASIKE